LSWFLIIFIGRKPFLGRGGRGVLLIEIHLKGHLCYYQSEKLNEVLLDVEVPVTLEELLFRLGIPASEIEGAFFNGKWILAAEPLNEGGRLDVLPIIGGG
jgi:sulfur carrier protein ThiS